MDANLNHGLLPLNPLVLSFTLDRACAELMDQKDPLKDLRKQYHIPSKSSLAGHTAPGDEPGIYLCGHQIGLQPHRTAELVNHHLRTWATQGMYGLVKLVDGSPLPTWGAVDRVAAEMVAPIVGGRPAEISVMGGLTANLHLLMASFYRPSHGRTKIIMERDSFSSDHYAVQSHLQWHNLDIGRNLILIEPDSEKTLALSTTAILSVINDNASEAALLILSGVQYLTGQLLDMEQITRHAHEKGITVGWDLAHAVGNVELYLHDWGVDFAVWCNYKYMNSGPGSIAGIFVHECHGHVDRSQGPHGYRQRLSGWWGNDMNSRFAMHPTFAPSIGAAGYQVSNASVMDTVALVASLEVFNQTSMRALRQKSIRLTGYLYYLLSQITPSPFEIMTSPFIEERGAQLSLRFSDKACLDDVVTRLKGNGVAVAATHDVMRLAPVPLYNTFADIWNFVDQLRAALALVDLTGK